MRMPILLAPMLALVVVSSPALATVGSACLTMGDASACTPPVDLGELPLPLGPVHDTLGDPENGTSDAPGPEDVTVPSVPSDDEVLGALPDAPEGPDGWDGPTFPVGRCLTTQQDEVGRLVCIAETPLITLFQVWRLLGADPSA